jgi:hypothetical protein
VQSQQHVSFDKRPGARLAKKLLVGRVQVYDVSRSPDRCGQCGQSGERNVASAAQIQSQSCARFGPDMLKEVGQTSRRMSSSSAPYAADVAGHGGEPGRYAASEPKAVRGLAEGTWMERPRATWGSRNRPWRKENIVSKDVGMQRLQYVQELDEGDGAARKECRRDGAKWAGGLGCAELRGETSPQKIWDRSEGCEQGVRRNKRGGAPLGEAAVRNESNYVEDVEVKKREERGSSCQFNGIGNELTRIVDTEGGGVVHACNELGCGGAQKPDDVQMYTGSLMCVKGNGDVAPKKEVEKVLSLSERLEDARRAYASLRKHPNL